VGTDLVAVFQGAHAVLVDHWPPSARITPNIVIIFLIRPQHGGCSGTVLARRQRKVAGRRDIVVDGNAEGNIGRSVMRVRDTRRWPANATSAATSPSTTARLLPMIWTRASFGTLDDQSHHTLQLIAEPVRSPDW